MRVLTTILLAFFALNFSNAQSVITEGYISYSASIDSEEPAAALLAVGTSLEVAFKGYRTKIVAKAAGNTVSIVGDHKTKTGLSLMDIMGERKAVKLTSKELDKANKELEKLSDKPMRYTESTKVIAGYTCQKVFMKDKESGANIILYLTNKIKPKNDALVKTLIGEIKGFPLGVVVRKDDTTVSLMATSVTSKTPSDGAFSTKVPSDYTLTTFEELENTAKEKIEKQR